MKQNSTFAAVTTAPAFVAQDYQRGWELAQKEYLRQQKQARLKPTTRRLPQATYSPEINTHSYRVPGN